MNKDIIIERLNNFKKAMQENGIDYYLVFTSDYHQSEYVDSYFKTREFISGFTGSAGWMLISYKHTILWVDGRYYVQAAAQIKDTGIEMYKHGLTDTPSILEYLSDNLKEGDVIATDGRTISVDFYKELKNIVGSNTLITDIDLFDKVWTDRPKMNCNPLIELDISISGQSRKDKLDFVRKCLKSDSVDAYFAAELSTIMWLTNLRGSDVECNPVAFSYLYISQNDAVLFSGPSAISSEIEKSLNADGIKLSKYESINEFLADINDKTIGLDFNEVNSLNYSVLCQNNRIKNVKNYLYAPKQIKNQTEIKLARKYHELDAVAMIKFIKYIKEAVKTNVLTEMDAADKIDGLRSEIDGFTGLSFDTISGYGINGAIVHYSPERETAATLKPEGFLLVDSGGQYMGATTDITRTIVLGPISDEQKKHFTAVLKAVISLATVKFLKGINGSNLDILARSPIWNMGIDYRHGTGHGIGAFLNVHEGPQNIRYKLRSEEDAVAFEPGMITSDEPGIYIEGSHGIRTENEILCVNYADNEWGTFYGFETLTLVPIDRDAIDITMLNPDELKWINDYHQKVYDKISPYLNDEEKEWLKSATEVL